ncbi:ABC transporter permease [Tepidibacter formicigenes]|uniref:Putative spermidine/putrescine transport system permease protein n=1 Tax=Tepidibacter formicigenes DSM 15518 TaxID=1123349 RepID=A0A1M6PZG9_9FIRM|nr:ABC transporter permease subunit [Tepidibacter formicigenes]SHK13287.1 putative spermidine/putrescine transport system permease protein [Tepidibacter formicigenes DSM 15518]
MNRKFWDKIGFGVLTAIILFGFLPVIFLFLLSVSNGWRWPELIPTSFSFEGWEYVFFNIQTIKGIWTSFKIALIVTIINLIIAIPASDAIGRYDFKGKKFIEIFLLMPIIFPPIISVMGIHKTFIKLNLTESILGVILSHIIPTLPYMIRVISISFKNLGFKWEEQAKMLGAGSIVTFMYVKFYFLLPGIVAGASLTVLISLSQYIITILIGGGQVVTLSTLMFPFINGGDKNIGAVYSILFAIVSIISLCIMELFLKKYYE